MTEREQEILAQLRQDPMIAQQELADRLGISRSALASHISSLIRQGYVQGRGYVLREGLCVNFHKTVENHCTNNDYEPN